MRQPFVNRTSALSEGMGGAVDGHAAEELRIDMQSGKVVLLAHAAEPLKRVLVPEGGVAKIPASRTKEVLKGEEIARLIKLSKSLPHCFPMLQNAQNQAAPAMLNLAFMKASWLSFRFVRSWRACRRCRAFS